ncbi:Cystathionine gamma-lyase [Carabus blaptoides fortunei]
MSSHSNSVENKSMGEENGFQPLPVGFMTKAIHVGQDPEQWNSLSVIPPITMSTTFKQHGPAEFKLYEYGRSGNPTRNVLEECLASLDGGKYGLTFSSGLGATSAIMSMLSAGDHIISGDDIYGGTNRLFSKVISRFGIESSFVDTIDTKNIVAAIKSNTKLIWIETPTNPTLKVNDIKAISEICKKHKIILVVDNSFLTSYFQRPLELGADMVIYSLTKYMNGHSDIVMGAVVTNDEDLHAQLRFLQNAMGIVPSPFDCSQVNRSLKTLGLRMRQHNQNGVAISKYLESHPNVIKVLNPGLPSHPHYERFKKQCSGHSGMITFFIKGGMEESKKFLKALKVFTLAESLGGFESLAELPCVMTHASVPPEQRKTLGITDNLIRLSVGLEDSEDLIADLQQALKAAA